MSPAHCQPAGRRHTARQHTGELTEALVGDTEVSLEFVSLCGKPYNAGLNRREISAAAEEGVAFCMAQRAYRRQMEKQLDRHLG